MRYDLYLGQMKIGRVIEQDSDFPNLWGQIAYDESLSQPKTEVELRFSKFLELNRQSMRLVDVEHKQDVSKELAAINAQLEEYRHYIESDDWYFIDEKGGKLSILCPVLRDGGEIVWRWNPQVFVA